MPLPHDSRHGIMAPINHPHIRRIQRILIASAVLSIVSFGFSMVLFAGFLSFYITPSAAAASIIFDATLLALTVKEERAEAAADHHEPEAGLGSSTRNEATGANHSTRLRSRQISATLRKPSIFVAIGLVVAWLGASGCLLYFLGSFSSLELGNENYKVFATILELMFNISHAAVLGSYAVKSWFERQRLLDPIVTLDSTTIELSLQTRDVKTPNELGSPTPASKGE